MLDIQWHAIGCQNLAAVVEVVLTAHVVKGVLCQDLDPFTRLGGENNLLKLTQQAADRHHLGLNGQTNAPPCLP